MNSTTIKTKLHGLRPLMFDRYPGDKKTKLEPLDKFYLNQNGQICIPTINVFSLLTAWNTASVSKMFYGREGKAIAMGVKASCDIESGDDDDPTNAVVRDELGQPFTPRDERIQVLEYVARTGQATPNETRRPVVPKGWTVDLTFHYMQNEFLQESTFRKMIEQGGVLGLGTFRPIFGRFAVEFLN